MTFESLLHHHLHTSLAIVKPATIHIVLSLALSNNWPHKQLDVNNAFLNGTLCEKVYVS